MPKHFTLIALLLVILSGPLCSQENATIPGTAKTAITRLVGQLKSYPQEKIYLHCDKPYYAVGDYIWFRAHIVHAALHIPYELSRYIYVELVDDKNVVIARKKIKPIDGMYYGQMTFSLDAPEGWYSLRAYTNFMRNLDETYFYRKPIYIGNNVRDQEKAKKDAQSETVKSTTRTADKPFTVQFFPEGEHLIPGNPQTVGIKAFTSDKNSATLTGKIVDDKKNEVAVFTCAEGLGSVTWMPEEGQNYTALCKDEKGNQLTVPLPAVATKEVALKVQQNAVTVLVSIITPNSEPLTDTLLLIIHQRGVPIYQDYFTADKSELSFKKSGISEGLLQLLLINRKNETLSERQLFIQDNDKIQVILSTDKITYRRRDQVNATIQLSTADGTPIKGNFSMSVTDDADITINPDDETIESRLTLQSEFEDYIQQPNRFFQATNKQASNQLDIFMLTHKWSRYSVSSVVKGVTEKGDRFPLERGSTVTGKVISYPSKKGLSGKHVSLIVQNANHFDAITTDNEGRFFFQGFEFPDSSKILLEAKMGTTDFFGIVVDNDTFPEVNQTLYTLTNPALKTQMKSFMNKSRERYLQEFGLKTINLKGVEIIAQKQEKERLNKFRLDRGVVYFNPSYTFGKDRLETANTLMDLLITAPGVSSNSGGTGVLMRNATPMIMVDNIKRDMSELSNLKPEDVELIDIINDAADLAAYGTSGANGVIFIHLKRGEKIVYSKEPTPNQAFITPLGFCVPLTFNQPDYLKPEIKMNGMPDLRTTLFWKPNVVCDETGKARVSFFMGDNQGPCTVTIEGVTSDGKIIRYQGKINAKK